MKSMFKIKLFLLACFCVGICGCGPDCEDSYSRASGRPRIISIFNDSLAIFSIERTYLETESYQNGLGCADGNVSWGNYRLDLFWVNYRNKQKPLLKDTLNVTDLTIIGDYFENNSILLLDINKNKFSFWKVGEKSIEFKQYNNLNNCYLRSTYPNSAYVGRNWLNGNVLLKHEDGIKDECSLLMLDVKNGNLEPLEFFDEYEWLSDCIDMSYIGGKIACVRKNSTGNNFELVVNNIVTDTIDGVTNWYGNYIRGKIIEDVNIRKTKTYKINQQTFKFDITYIPIWIWVGSSFFYEEISDNYISYYPEDFNWREKNE